MYVLAPGHKDDPVRRWALPDRVFFASGACHILAYALLDAYPAFNFAAVWIKPARGFTGNHIVAVRGDTAFDYHGYSSWSRLLMHPPESQSMVAGMDGRTPDAVKGGADLGEQVAAIRWTMAARTRTVSSGRHAEGEAVPPPLSSASLRSRHYALAVALLRSAEPRA